MGGGEGGKERTMETTRFFFFFFFTEGKEQELGMREGGEENVNHLSLLLVERGFAAIDRGFRSLPQGPLMHVCVQAYCTRSPGGVLLGCVFSSVSRGPAVKVN